MGMEDVGLRARIDGLQSYLAGAKQIQTETNKVGHQMTETARESQSASAGIVGSLKAVGPMFVAAAAAMAGAAIVGGFKSAVSAASDLNETVNKVDVVFGAASESVKAFADSSATALGMSKNEALSAAGTFGNLFTTIGLGQKQSAEFSTNLLQNAADLASFNNIDPTVVLDKLRAGLVGETEPLRALGIDVSDAALQIEALRQGITKSTADMTQAEKVQLRYALVQKQVGNAAGDFARTSTGLANSQRILAAEFKNIEAEIGQQLLPVVAPLVSAFARELPKAFDAIRPSLAAVGQGFQDAMTIIGNLGTALAPVGQAFATLSGIFTDFGTRAGPGVSQALGDIGRVVNEAFAGILDAVGPIVEDLLLNLQGTFNAIAAEVGPAMESIGGTLRGTLDMLLGIWDQFGPSILRATQDAFGLVAGVIKGALAIAGGVLMAFLDVVQGDWSGAWDHISQIPGQVMADIGPAIGNILADLYTAMAFAVKELGLQDAWYNIRDFVIGVWTDIGNGIRGEINKVIVGLNAFINEINKVLSALGMAQIGSLGLLDLQEAVKLPRPDLLAANFANTIRDAFGSVQPEDVIGQGGGTDWGSAIRDWIGGLTEGIGTEAAPAATAALKGVQQAGQGVGPAIASGADAGKAALAGLQDAARATQSALQDAQAAMRGFSDPRLVGQQAAEDELFQLEQDIKRARLAELLLGEAAQEATAAVGESFDVLGAQQRELAQGIPVALQKLEWERRQAERTANQPVTARPGESETQRLQRQREIRQLQMELNFEPQQRILREMYEELTGANKEITFAQAKAGLEAAAAAVVVLTRAVEATTKAVERQQAAMEAGKSATVGTAAAANQVLGTTQQQVTAHQDVLAVAEEVVRSYQEQLAAQDEQFDVQTGEMANLTNILGIHPSILAAMAAETAEAQRTAAAANEAALAYSQILLASNDLATRGGNEAAGILPGMAEGGEVKRGGLVRVGEQGEETVYLPRGARVFPHGSPETRATIATSQGQRSNAIADNRQNVTQSRDNTLGMLARERLAMGEVVGLRTAGAAAEERQLAATRGVLGLSGAVSQSYRDRLAATEAQTAAQRAELSAASELLGIHPMVAAAMQGERAEAERMVSAAREMLAAQSRMPVRSLVGAGDRADASRQDGDTEMPLRAAPLGSPRAREMAMAPTTTTVLPNTAMQPASVSRISHEDHWNIQHTSSPIAVADEVRRVLAWQRIRAGRR